MLQVISKVLFRNKWRKKQQQQLFYSPLSGTTRESCYQKNHSLTILIINHSLSASSIYYNPQHPPCSIYVLDSLLAQPLFKSSLVYLLVWNLSLHTQHISSPIHCLLFATHAHTIAICFAVVPRLCHIVLVSRSTPYLELSFTLTLHIHLTILVSAH